MPALRRELGLLDATAVTISTIVGAGIFFVPSRVAAQFPDATLILGLWVAGGLVSLAGALTVSELAAMFPRSGGPYEFVREGLGPLAGFVVGWNNFTLSLGVRAGVLLVFAQYVAFFVPLSPVGIALLAVWAGGSMTYLNALGVRLGARVVTVLTALKVAALVGLVVGVAVLAPAAPSGTAPAGGNLSLALLLVLFAYNSWIVASFLGDEVRDPQRTLPRAILLGTLAVIALYLAANLAFLRALGPAGMAASSLVASDSLQRATATGGAVIAGAVVVSTYGNSFGGFLSLARVPYQMARRGELPAMFARLNRHGVPDVALLSELVFASLFIATGTFEAAATVGVLAIWVGLVLVGVAYFALRRARPGAARPYRVPLYPLAPGVFLIGALFVVGVTVLQQPAQAALTGLLIAAGLPLFAWQRHRTARGGLARLPEIPVG